MKIQSFKSQLIGFGVAAIVAGVALAGPGTLRFIDLDAWDQKAAGDVRGGGPFEAIPTGFGDVQGIGLHGADTVPGSYITFCVELNEHVGRTIYDAVLNTEAIEGGVGGGNPDPLDAQTAFLYTAFLKGTLNDKLDAAGKGVFTYGAGLSGIALQEAIWVIENELDPDNGDLISGLAEDLIALADAATAVGGDWYNKWGDGIGNVRILNLTKTDAFGNISNKQDNLILIPLPIPAVMALVGLLGVGVVSTRRRRHG